MYLVTYSQADLAKFPTREDFLCANMESFSTGRATSFSRCVQGGVNFSSHLYVPEIDPVTGNVHHDRGDYNVVDVAARKSILLQKRLCFNCTGPHNGNNCHSKITCQKCKQKHHTSICDSAPSSL